MHKLLAVRILSTISLTAALSCTRKIPEPEPVPAQPAALSTSTPAEPAPAPAPEAPKPKGPSDDFIGYPKEGWSKLKLNDTLPLCVFQDAIERDNAKFVAQATKAQKLKANQPVTFGAFGPYCINPQCDDLPTLQCLVDREGSTLKVRARYVGYHKDGASCSDSCAEVIAGCDSPSLEPGKYTVQYGDNTYALKIPSTLRDPCFKKE